MKFFIEVIDKIGLSHTISIKHIVEMVDVSDMEDKDYNTVIYLSNGIEIPTKESISTIINLMV